MIGSSLESCFKGKTVLVTGHTGFKGSWLSIWLNMLGAKVVGVSDRIPTSPSNFEASEVGRSVEDIRINLIEHESVYKVIEDTAPDFVFHLAAQALVNKSYQDPIETLQTNIMGTANLLDALRNRNKKCVAVMITSDKCYDNVEWEWGYRENDRLGGKDPYSASKGGAEFVIRTFFESYLKNSLVRLGTARAGNVIGGGDWAADRLVPDCVRAWSDRAIVKIKNPNTTRPWQLVLEPLGGYLCLAMSLDRSDTLSGEAFNFGPLAESNYSVIQLIEAMQQYWENVRYEVTAADTKKVYEAGLLKLNCDKALLKLKWKPTYDFSDTVASTVSWYKDFYQNCDDMRALCEKQIQDYFNASREQEIEWAL
ncbi:MAG: CDP-glucose 4,6-dehydratase [bacterium]